MIKQNFGKLTLKLSLFVGLISLLSLCGCQNKKKNDDALVPAENMYEDAIKLFQRQEYKKASEAFDEIFLNHPGSKITSQAELMQAYSLYLAGEYDEAVDILDIFIKLHPSHEDIAYAYYLKGLSLYMNVSSVKLDQTKTYLAKLSFEELIQHFPKTKYAIDAALKLDLVNDHLAGKEMEVGRYYLNKKNYIAAIKRFQQVVDKYSATSHKIEALYRLVECFVSLGINDEAKKLLSTLERNYPASIWYQYAYNLLEK